MHKNFVSPQIEELINIMAKLPGFGRRSAQRAVLHIIKTPENFLHPLQNALENVSSNIKGCSICGNVDVDDPCMVCSDDKRNNGLVCVVEDISDLWALERANAWAGRYHILGGVLSVIDGSGPEDINIPALVERVNNGEISEVLLAMNANIDGQSTAHYISQLLASKEVKISRLAHGVPVGGELDYLDEGTIIAAIKSRKDL